MIKYFIKLFLLTISISVYAAAPNIDLSNKLKSLKVVDKVGLGICKNFYNSTFKPVVGKAKSIIDSRLKSNKPEKAVPYKEPAFNTCVVRVSDYQKEDIPGRAVPFYSRSQSFNADSSKFILQGAHGYWHLYDTSNLNYIRRVDLGGSDIEINWHSQDPNLLYKMDHNGGMRILLHDISDVTDKSIDIVADFRNVKSIAGYPGITDINKIWPKAARFFTASDGAASSDDRYWALMAVNEDFTSHYGIIVYDMLLGAIVGVYDYKIDGGIKVGPHYVTMTPSGKYVVAVWSPPSCSFSRKSGRLNSPCGAMVFNKSFTTGRSISSNIEHADTAVGAKGEDIYVAIEYEKAGSIEIIDIESGDIISKAYTQAWAPGAFHFSGRSVYKPGWIFISSYGQVSNNGFDNRVMAVSLTRDPKIINLAHHYSSSKDYFSQPHATVNKQGTKVLFGSDWGGNPLNADTYMISIPDYLTDL